MGRCTVVIGERDVSKDVQGLSCSSVINGGHADAEVQLGHSRREYSVEVLQPARISVGGTEIWRGIVTDVQRDIGRAVPISVGMQGFQRLLEWRLAVLPYLIRDLEWNVEPPVQHNAQFLSGTTSNFGYIKPGFDGAVADEVQILTGGVDPADRSKRGVRFVPDGAVAGSVPGGFGYGVELELPAAGARRFKAKLDFNGTNFGTGIGNLRLWIGHSPTGATSSWTAFEYTSDQTVSLSLPEGTKWIRIGLSAGTSSSSWSAITDYASVESIRVLGTTLDEDVTATANQEGFYATSVLRDLVGRVPDMHADIDVPFDFVISQLGDFGYRTLRSLVDEVMGYVDGYWGVYGNRLLVRKAKGPEWVIDARQYKPSISVTAEDSWDEFIVNYEDAVTGLRSQVAFASPTPNPFTTSSYVRQALIEGGVMTSNTASRLAQIASEEMITPGAGSVTLPALAYAPGRDAVLIKPGDRVSFLGLPLGLPNSFDVLETSFNLDDMSVTLSVGNFRPLLDVLLARLTAVTRAVTG